MEIFTKPRDVEHIDDATAGELVLDRYAKQLQFKTDTGEVMTIRGESYDAICEYISETFGLDNSKVQDGKFVPSINVGAFGFDSFMRLDTGADVPKVVNDSDVDRVSVQMVLYNKGMKTKLICPKTTIDDVYFFDVTDGYQTLRQKLAKIDTLIDEIRVGAFKRGLTKYTDAKAIENDIDALNATISNVNINAMLAVSSKIDKSGIYNNGVEIQNHINTKIDKGVTKYNTAKGIEDDINGKMSVGGGYNSGVDVKNGIASANGSRAFEIGRVEGLIGAKLSRGAGGHYQDTDNVFDDIRAVEGWATSIHDDMINTQLPNKFDKGGTSYPNAKAMEDDVVNMNGKITDNINRLGALEGDHVSKGAVGWGSGDDIKGYVDGKVSGIEAAVADVVHKGADSYADGTEIKSKIVEAKVVADAALVKGSTIYNSAQEIEDDITDLDGRAIDLQTNKVQISPTHVGAYETTDQIITLINTKLGKGTGSLPYPSGVAICAAIDNKFDKGGTSYSTAMGMETAINAKFAKGSVSYADAGVMETNLKGLITAVTNKLPTPAQQQLKTCTDCNTVSENGIYFINTSTSNQPISAQKGYMITSIQSSGYTFAMQTIYYENGSIYQRTRYSSTNPEFPPAWSAATAWSRLNLLPADLAPITYQLDQQKYPNKLVVKYTKPVTDENIRIINAGHNSYEVYTNVTIPGYRLVAVLGAGHYTYTSRADIGGDNAIGQAYMRYIRVDETTDTEQLRVDLIANTANSWAYCGYATLWNLSYVEGNNTDGKYTDWIQMGKYNQVTDNTTLYIKNGGEWTLEYVRMDVVTTSIVYDDDYTKTGTSDNGDTINRVRKVLTNDTVISQLGLEYYN